MNLIEYPCNVINKIELVDDKYVYDLKVDKDDNYINYDNYHDMSKKKNEKYKKSRKYTDSVEIRSLENINYSALKNREVIEFCWFFNEPIDNMQWGDIKIVIFGNNFNQPIDNVDWCDVRTLIFGYDFNQPVNNVNWKNITKLTFGYNFNQPIDNVDWLEIKKVTLGWMYSCSINTVNWKSVEKLILTNNQYFIGDMLYSRPPIVNYVIPRYHGNIVIKIYNKPVTKKKSARSNPSYE